MGTVPGQVTGPVTLVAAVLVLAAVAGEVTEPLQMLNLGQTGKEVKLMDAYMNKCASVNG